MEGNFCFLCLEQLEGEELTKVKVKRGRKRNEDVLNNRKSTRSIKLLLKYLVNCDGYNVEEEEGVLKDVLKLGGLVPGPEGEGNGPCSRNRNGLFRTCGRCEAAAGTVLGLKLELEQLQMRMVNEVREVRERILRGSGWLGGSGAGGAQEEDLAFEHFSKRFLGGSCSSPKMKYFFHVLKRFQGAVKKIDKDSVHVPLVYLERSRIPHPSPSGPGLIDPAPLEKNVKVEVGIPLEPDAYQGQGPGMDTDQEEGDSFQDYFLEDNVAEADCGPTDDNDVNGVKNFAGGADPVKKEPEPNEATSTSTLSSSAVPGSCPDELDTPVKWEPLEDEEELNTRRSRRRTCATYASGPRPKKLAKKRERVPKGSPLKKKFKVDRVKRVKSAGIRKSKLTTSGVRKSGGSASTMTPEEKSSHRSRYTCSICPFTVIKVGAFEQHLREHETPEKVFHCEACNNLGFSTEQLHTFHKEQHGGFHKLKCDLCQYRVDVLGLPAHLKGHDVATLFPCSSCSHCSSSAEKYIGHLRSVHSFKDGRKVKCQLCGDEFRNRNKLASHFYEVHKAIPKLECDFEGCSRTFLEAEALSLHKVSHSGRFDCGECGRGCTSRADLRFHRQVVHQKERAHKCDHCPRAFAAPSLLLDHLIQQHGAEKLKCKLCAKEYSSNSGLQYHMAVSHEEGNGKPCPICNKKFDAAFRLKNHIESHSTERNYVCEECGSSFRTVRNYNDHRRRVHKPKPEKKHQCSYCERCYSIRKDLTAHIRTHTGERPYVCDFCGKAFAHSGSFFNHKKSCSLRSSRVIKSTESSNSSALSGNLIGHHLGSSV